MKKIEQDVTESTASLLGSKVPQPFLFLHFNTTLPRLHHSSFIKPEVEYLATHILSNLQCTDGGDDWSMDFVNSMNGLKDDIEIVPIARQN